MKQSHVLLSIIIVSYNTKELLEKCIKSIVGSLKFDAGNVKTTDRPYASNLKPQASSVLKSLTPDAGNVKTTGQPHASNLTPQASSASYEIIVVDNHSTDGTREYLEKFQNSKTQKLKKHQASSKRSADWRRVIKLQTIFNNDNLGFAKANNQGIKIAEGKYILLLNSDTIVSPQVLEKMIEFAGKKKEI